MDKNIKIQMQTQTKTSNIDINTVSSDAYKNPEQRHISI